MKVDIEKGPCKKTLYLVFSLVIVMLGIGFFVYTKKHHCESSARFINKDFVCNSKPVVDKKGYAKIQSEIEEFVEGEKQQNRADHVSVYFRDLINGPVFGIGEYEDFAPASLLKLPLALVYMVLAEENPDIFSESLLFTKSDVRFVREFGQNELESGVSYTIEDLLSFMIVRSDNDAYLLLYDYLTNTYGEKIIYDTYLELGILAPQDMYDEIISVRRYGSLFRALYNVSLVNEELSEKLLSWLAQSTFAGGLQSAVPPHISIAHKFGERGLRDGSKQLHDCGIVYYPDNPYLLCIMTQGKNFDDLVKVISHISKLIYQEFDSRRL